MNDEHPPVSPDRVPTLTEVLEFGVAGAVLPEQIDPVPADEAVAVVGPDEPAIGTELPLEDRPALLAAETGEGQVSEHSPAVAAEPEPALPMHALPVADLSHEASFGPSEVSPSPSGGLTQSGSSGGAHSALLLAMPALQAAPTTAALSASIDAHALVSQVLAELQPRIDMLFESRLREALAPALARVADGLIRETRDELSGALRDLVEDAVTRAQQRRAHQR